MDSGVPAAQSSRCATAAPASVGPKTDSPSKCPSCRTPCFQTSNHLNVTIQQRQASEMRPQTVKHEAPGKMPRGACPVHAGTLFSQHKPQGPKGNFPKCHKCAWEGSQQLLFSPSEILLPVKKPAWTTWPCGMQRKRLLSLSCKHLSLA